jgi:hypothetical protein
MLLLGFMFGWGGGMDSLKGIGKYFPFCLICLAKQTKSSLSFQP